MTLPDERYNAVIRTRKLLINLLNPQHTPRVPKLIRDEARSCLRHFPNDWEMVEATQSSPHLFQDRMEDLYRMVKQYELEKERK